MPVIQKHIQTYTANWDVQIAGMIFQTRFGIFKRQGDSICNFPALLLLCRSGNLCNSSFS
ncbi:DUF6783 domain-containing protein [Anaerobutyricum hallii]|uniref:DUF6783 domain-containing protein n=1 Tax=Anaerobutyricum hallii TaxID=39488 RepID=UPI003FA47419